MRLADTTPLQRAAAGGALLNAALLATLQLTGDDPGAPLPLFVLFVGLWLFGALMLVAAPRFGAAGTAAWGTLAAIAALRTHRGLDLPDVLIVTFSALGAALALAFLARLLRR